MILCLLAVLSQNCSAHLFEEAPQNAPAGGAYLRAYYDAPIAPHQVDWYWQPQAGAIIPSGTRILFDRAGLARDDRPTVFVGGRSEFDGDAMNVMSFFWAMLMITAKYAVRSPHAGEMKLLPYTLDPFYKTQHLAAPGKPLLWAEAIPAHNTPEEKLRLLRRLAGDMRAMMAQLKARGAQVPDAILSGASRYLDLAEAAMTFQPTRP